jgi:VWFA-related protein
LKQEDFEILEDGVAQEIATFRLVDIPVAPVPVTAEKVPFVVPDVRTNEVPAEGRIYVLVLDEMHTAPERSGVVRQVARDFIENWMGEGDWVAVTNTSGRADASHDFTDNRQVLLEAIDKFMGRKLRSMTLERLDVLEQIQQGEDPDSAVFQLKAVEREHAYQAQTALAHLRSVSRMLGSIQGRRKAIVFVSEGIAYDVHDFIRSESVVVNDVRSAIGIAGLYNVSFYTLDVRGLGAGQGDAIMFSQSPAALAGSINKPSPGSLDPQARALEKLIEEASKGVGAIHEEVQRSQESLRVLSHETGGIAVVNQNDVGEGLRRIVDDNSHYYLLGYYPAHDLSDGKYRRIEVRVKRPGVKVRTRKGYVSSKITVGEARESEPLSDVLNSPLPASGLPIRVFAAPIGLNQKKATVPVVVETAIDGFHFAEKDGHLNDKVEISVFALDDNGEVVENQRRSFALSIRPEVRGFMLEDGFRSMLVLELPPGSYQLRIGVHETGADRAGSVHYDLEVPERADHEPVMSGLLLTSRKNNGIPFAAREEDKNRVPVIPSTRRRFTPDDELLVYAEAFAPKKKSAQTDLTIRALVRRAGGEVVSQIGESDTKEDRSSDHLSSEFRVDISTLPPGHYTLELQILDENGSLRAKRSTLFGTSAVPKVMEPITYGLGSYRDLVTMYRDGQFEAARERIAEWPPDAAGSAVTDLIKTQPDAQTLMTAALLHAEIILFPREEMRELVIEQQLEFGKELIDSVRDESLRRSFFKDWLLGLVYYFQGTNLSRSRDYLRWGADLFGEDAQILLALGVTHECIAERHNNSESLVEAEDAYRNALEIDLELEEAHLRLGIVLGEYGPDYEEEALDELNWVVEHSQESYLLYLAHLSLGEIHEIRGRWEEAAEAYRSAVKAQPEWRNAYGALFRALYNAGDLEGARQVESSMPTSREDVYRLYYLGLVRRLPDTLRHLRQRVVVRERE